MKNKKPFLLIEILVAIFIISLCIVPFIQTPIQNYRREIALFEEMEGERLADWSFMEIKEKLLKNEIPWEKLPEPNSQSETFFLPPSSIQIPGCSVRKLQRSFILKCKKKGQKEGLKGEVYRMLTIEISFEPKLSKKNKYNYRLIVRKIPPV